MKNRKNLHTLRCRQHIIALDQPRIMGILNVTPDSFYDGGKYKSLDAALRQAETMLQAGADFLDVGGASSKPAAQEVSEEEELQRVLPVVEALVREFPSAIISIDTYRARVARSCVEAGASMVNDVSAGRFDAAMYDTVATLQCPYILMHLQGTPQTMQQNPQYEDLLQDILAFFVKELSILREKGVRDVLLDVGFGFGKTLDQNYELMKNLSQFQVLDLPLLVGVSRKSMVYKLLETDASLALNGSSILHFFALQQGAKILRVHDVAPAMEVVRMWEMLR